VFLTLLTVAIVAVGAVRGYLAATESGRRYPCAFQQKVGGRWVGKLSFTDAERIRLKSVRVGELVAPVRLNDVTKADVIPMIRCMARAYGMAPGPFIRVAECETHLTPDQNLYQYLPPTWASSSRLYGHAGAAITDGYAQIHVTVQKVKAEGWGAWGRCI
jgi:hypothetical protein